MASFGEGFFYLSRYRGSESSLDEESTEPTLEVRARICGPGPAPMHDARQSLPAPPVFLALLIPGVGW